MAVYNLNTHYTAVVPGFLADCQGTLHGCLERLRHCVDQLAEEQVWWRPHENMNAVGNLLLHLCGNLRQWIISGVGDTPDARQRQAEFDQRAAIPKQELMRRLEAVIAECLAVAERQTEADLLRVRPVQHYQTTGLTALFHAVCHLEGHTQEVVYITRLLLGERYQFLWTPPGTP